MQQPGYWAVPPGSNQACTAALPYGAATAPNQAQAQVKVMIKYFLCVCIPCPFKLLDAYSINFV